MDSSRGCPVVCCGKLLAIAALLLVPVAAVVAVSPWSLPTGDPVSIAADDAAGLNIVEPALQERPAAASSRDNTQVERQARDWTFTAGPRPSSNR